MALQQQRYVGVDVGGTKILAMLVAGQGEVLARFKAPTQHDGTPLAAQISAAVDGLLADAGVDAGDVGGIGLAVPGVVDGETGAFVTAPNLEVDDPHMVEGLRERYELPVAIGNDVNLGTLAECWRGAGRGARTVVGVFVGTGIGGGVVVDGRLRTGPEDLAGEVGHLVLMVDGPECGCGNLGCFEALASRTAMERTIREGLAAGRESCIADAAAEGRIKSGALASALEAGDELVTEVLQRAAHYLGHGLLSIRHLLDPDLIILGGGVIEACSAFFLPRIESEIRADRLRGSRDTLRIAVSELGDDAVALGAAAHVRAEISGMALDEFALADLEGPALPSYPTIDDVRFGAVTVDGDELCHDIYIRATGKLRKRSKKRPRKKYGTSHVIDERELARLCKGAPQTVLIGTGFREMLRLSDDARDYADALGLQLQLLPSPDAVTAYNEAEGLKALLLHVTC